MREWIRSVDQWWFGRVRPESMGLLRIIVGALAFCNLSLLSFDFSNFYSQKGFVTGDIVHKWLDYPSDKIFLGTPIEVTLPFGIPRFTLIPPDSSDGWMLAVYLVGLACALLFSMGLFSRISGIGLASCMISLHLRNPAIIHAGDTLLRLFVIYLALGQPGAAYSLDRRRAVARGDASPQPPLVSAWPQKLIQFQIALCYFMTVWQKWFGHTWKVGTATWYPTQLHEFDRFPMPGFLERQPFIGITTYATLLVEISLATLVFYTPWRRWVLTAGIGLHAYIEYRFNIPFFAITIVAGYIAFYDGEEVDAWLKRRFPHLFSKNAPALVADKA